jgi:hypothetical protein
MNGTRKRGPVQRPGGIPARVLAPGKYVFELADIDSDCNIVRLFSDESNGKERLIATRVSSRSALDIGGAAFFPESMGTHGIWFTPPTLWIAPSRPVFEKD